MLSCTVPRTAHNHYKLPRPLGLTSTPPPPPVDTNSLSNWRSHPFQTPTTGSLSLCCQRILYSTRVCVRGVVWWCYGLRHFVFRLSFWHFWNPPRGKITHSYGTHTFPEGNGSHKLVIIIVRAVLFVAARTPPARGGGRGMRNKIENQNQKR